jgi:hypothetical protein
MSPIKIISLAACFKSGLITLILSVGPEESQEILNQDIRNPERMSKVEPPEYALLTYNQRLSVFYSL